jgi:hypothetical protein
MIQWSFYAFFLELHSLKPNAFGITEFRENSDYYGVVIKFSVDTPHGLLQITATNIKIAQHWRVF